MIKNIKRILAFILASITLFTVINSAVFAADIQASGSQNELIIRLGYMRDNKTGLVLHCNQSYIKTVKQAELLSIDENGERITLKSYINSENSNWIDGTEIFYDFTFLPAEKSLFKENGNYCLYIVQSAPSAEEADIISEHSFAYSALFYGWPRFTANKLTVERDKALDLRDYILIPASENSEENFEQQVNERLSFYKESKDQTTSPTSYMITGDKTGDVFNVIMEENKNSIGSIRIEVIQKVPQNFSELIDVTFDEFGSRVSSAFSVFFGSFIISLLSLIFTPALLIELLMETVFSIFLF